MFNGIATSIWMINWTTKIISFVSYCRGKWFDKIPYTHKHTKEEINKRRYVKHVNNVTICSYWNFIYNLILEQYNKKSKSVCALSIIHCYWIRLGTWFSWFIFYLIIFIVTVTCVLYFKIIIWLAYYTF